MIFFLVANFLPMKPFQPDSPTLYDSPVSYALKFVRILMSWGRNITKDMLTKFDIGARILCYLTIEPERSSKVQESLRLIVESGRAWVTCLRYGLATTLFTEYHPIFMKHLTYFVTHLSMTDDVKASKFNYHFAVVILEIIQAALFCAPNHEEMFRFEDKSAIDILQWDSLI